MRVALVRHPPPAIAAGICYGRTDLPLRPDAAVAVAAIVARLSALRLACIWTSPARRCRAVAEATGLPMRVDARLLELDFGDWEGRRWDDLPRAALDAWAADPQHSAPPGGERGAALLARVTAFHAAISAAGEDCAVVAHGGPLKLLAALLRGEAPDLLSAAPPIGSVHLLSTPSAAHSAATQAAPSTSPV